jgi:hypothetical protein
MYRTATTETPDTETRSLLLAGTDEAIGHLKQLLTTGPRTTTERKAEESLNRFAEFRLATADEVLKRAPSAASPQDDVAVFEAVLHPDPDVSRSTLLPLTDEHFDLWVSYVRRFQGRVDADYRRTVGGLTFVPVHVRPDATEELTRFNLLRAIRPMPLIRPLPAGLLRSAPRRLEPPANVDPVSDARVAIFDTGLDAPSELFPNVAEAALASKPPGPGVAHGSAVTGAVLYGAISQDTTLLRPAARVVHARVLPPDVEDLDGYWVLDQIEAFVKSHEVDIVNLSIGPDAPVEDDAEPHRWTLTLDELAYEHGVLFVTAAGNFGERPPDFNRVASPADMVNGLSVGACDQHAPATPWVRAPYSQVGPGRHGARLQPCGVQFGGTAANPFAGLQSDGSLYATTGTSFAAPLVVNGLCRLAARLPANRLTHNNLRAFAVHFAERHGEPTTHELGYGRFLAHYDDALDCSPNEVHIHYEGTLRRGDVVAVPIPLPPGVTSGKVHLTGTLVFTAPVEPTQPLDYSQASIEMAFRPHATTFRLTMPGSKTHIVDAVNDAELYKELVGQGYAPSNEPVTRSPKGIPGGNELALREGGKWETVRVFTDSLRAASLDRPRLDLTYLSREAGLLTHAGDTLDYTLLMSIRTPGYARLYDDVRSQFSVLAPLPIQARVSITA